MTLPPYLHRLAEMLLRGLSHKEIAIEMGVSLKTVEGYVTRLRKRLGIMGRSRNELILRLMDYFHGERPPMPPICYLTQIGPGQYKATSKPYDATSFPVWSY